jgi:hypothetical protein
MKNSIATIILSILFVSSIALAYDMTHVREVKAHSSAQFNVELPVDKSITEVWTTHDEVISCSFIDKGTGKVSLESKDTTHCIGTATLTLPEDMIVKVENNNSSDVSVKIWVHTSDTKFEQN